MTARPASGQTSSFQTMCRHWRQTRKLSQLDLALAANVSQRHVSWLETGRSRPSREMVLRLSEAMDIPLRDRNLLFQAAGYAASYRETDLDQPDMAPVRDALQRILSHHSPLPAVVVDRYWNIKLRNQVAEHMLALADTRSDTLDDITPEGEANLALLTVHPQGLRQYVTNWDEAAPSFLRRLHHEALTSGDPKMMNHYQALSRLAGELPENPPVGASLLPVLPLELRLGDVSLSLFSVISTFGTPQDVTTDELRIEAFYPTDEATRDFFHAQA